jgi:glutathione synthase/RimK-type ligase-like ATP-grasp enzyme
MPEKAASDTDRELPRILRYLSSELGLAMSAGLNDHLIRLSHPDGRSILVFGYDFGLNPSSSAEIARDKGATAYLLRKAGVPCVDHRIIFRADWEKFTDQEGVYLTARKTFQEFREDVVCKNNRGTGGNNVFRACTFAEMELALSRIFNVHYACAVSPFLPIEREIRVIVVDGDITAIFSKQRPEVVGDGVSTLVALMAIQTPEALTQGKPLTPSAAELLSVPAAGERRVVNWRHNLGQGAKPDFDISSDICDTSSALAVQAVTALNLRAASVDVVWAAGPPTVLEVNSGIMTENLARSGPLGLSLAVNTYRALIHAGLNSL